VAKWSSEQIANANLIVNIGRSLGASDRDIQIALMTALQESGLRNLRYGDRDSQGLFQQRPSMGWGTVDQITDPTYAITTFFKGKPGNPGLFSIKDRDSLSLTQAAQKVQRSAFPDAYAKHESSAAELMGMVSGAAPSQVQGWQQDTTRGGVEGLATPGSELTTSSLDAALESVAGADGLGDDINPEDFGGETPESIQNLESSVAWMPQLTQTEFMEIMGGEPLPGDFNRPGKPVPSSGLRGAIVDEAMKYLGVNYVWGGASPTGFDCSGLVQYVFNKFGYELPRISYAQARVGKQIDPMKAQAGDLIAWDNSTRNAGADHIAIALGGGWILEAPRAGLSVRIRQLDPDEGAWGVDMGGMLGA
jgi:cell wall-associated NlpC family hydrolase